MRTSYLAWHSVDKNKTTEQENGYRSQPRCHFCHPLSKWRTMLIRRIDQKTRIDQGLKLFREAKELLSGSLSHKIPLGNSISIPNPNRSERFALF